MQTKAEIKRLKDLKERVNNVLRGTLKDFENNYLGSAVSWNIMNLERSLEAYKKAPLGKYDSEHSKQHTIKAKEAVLSRKHLLTFEFITEAKQSYDVKFNKMVDAVVYANLNYGFRVEKVNNSGSEFSFLISDGTTEVHARAIFVNGAIKAPHFRFITTTRKA